MSAETDGPLESRELEVLLLLALHGVVHQYPSAQDVQLALGEHGAFGQERRRRLAERVREEEAEDEAAEDGKDALGVRSRSGRCVWSLTISAKSQNQPACQL